MKKILVVSMSAQLGGIEKSLVNFLHYLEKCDCDVDLMLWKKQGELLTDIPEFVNIIDSPTPGSIRDIIGQKNILKFMKYLKLKRYARKGSAWRSFPNLKKKYDIAIAYTQDGYSPYYVIDNVCAGKKFLWYHHGAYLRTTQEKKIDEEYYKKFEHVITVSEANQQMLCSEFPLLQEQFIVIPNLIDETSIQNASKMPCNVFDGFEGCKITTVGRLSPEKGQLKALEVAYRLKEQGFKFKWCFVGSGPDMDECVKQIHQMELENYCIFVGAQVNPYSYMASADLFIQLSLVEADPVTIQEALILKKVIIASDIPSIREALQDGRLGVLCDNTLESTSQSIMECFENSNKREEILLAIEQSEKRNHKVAHMLNAVLFN